MNDTKTNSHPETKSLEARTHEARGESHSLSGRLPRLTALLAGVTASLLGFGLADKRRATPPETKQRAVPRVQPSHPALATAPTTPAPVPDSAADRTRLTHQNEKRLDWLALGKELITRFNEDEGFTRAAALAFVGVLSLAPLLLIVLAAIGFLIQDPQQAAEYVQKLAANLLPGRQGAQAANEIIQQTHIIESARGLMEGRTWAAVFGVLSLIWSAISLFVTASAPMNAAWDVKETRSFLKLRLTCLGLFAATGVLFLLSLLPSSGPNFIRSLHIPWLGLPEQVPFWVDMLFLLVAWAIDISMFVLIYKFLPDAKVTWKAALFGGVIIGVLWELFKKGFALYLAHFGNFNKLYGAFGGAVLLVTWIYYSCVILLVGATLAKMYHEHREEGGVAQRVR